MRHLAAVVLVALASTRAAADVAPRFGAFIDLGLGVSYYRGALATYDTGGQRDLFGVGVVHGLWGLEYVHTDVLSNWTGRCFECGRTFPQSSLEPELDGLDVRHTTHVRETPTGAVDVVLHGGPRLVTPFLVDTGTSARTQGSRGLGVGIGAALEVNARAASFYLDLSTDVMRIRHPDGTGLGSLPAFTFGIRLGWM